MIEPQEHGAAEGCEDKELKQLRIQGEGWEDSTSSLHGSQICLMYSNQPICFYSYT